MLMPVLEYNKHIAKIPNCKMRSLRACMQQLLLLLLLFGHSDVCRALDIAASNGGGGGGSSTGSGSGSGPGMGAGGGTALSGPPGALNANLTDLGSPVFTPHLNHAGDIGPGQLVQALPNRHLIDLLPSIYQPVQLEAAAAETQRCWEHWECQLVVATSSTYTGQAYSEVVTLCESKSNATLEII